MCVCHLDRIEMKNETRERKTNEIIFAKNISAC